MQKPIIHDVEQGTEEWYRLRLGVVTASRFKDVLSKGQGKTRKSYMFELAAEILTSENADSFQSKDMVSGIEREPEAIEFYSLMTGYNIRKVGFITRPDIPGVGVSPDCLVGDDGLAEIKCPRTTTQLKRWQDKRLPSEYVAQVQGQLWISCRKWCDWVSRDHRIDGDASYLRVPVERDEEYIANLASEVQKFRVELEEMVINARGVL